MTAALDISRPPDLAGRRGVSGRFFARTLVQALALAVFAFFLFGPLADKVGRKAVLIFATAAFGVASIASASATSCPPPTCTCTPSRCR